jgi:hypothetical protein
MTPEQLSTELRTAAPVTGELIYLERCGDDYRWARGEVQSTPSDLPDAWMYFTGEWPIGEDDRWKAFFDDLIAELDSMAARGDRCRWSLDDPWPHGGLRG